MERPVKVLMSRDDFYHQRGYWVVIHALRNAGMEVLLGGIQTPAEIAATALQEDVEVIGYRIMNGAPKVLLPILFARMKELGIVDKPVVVGGIVPEKDEKGLRELGVREIFHPFALLEEIQARVSALAATHRTR